jgi:hypothetical protein
VEGQTFFAPRDAYTWYVWVSYQSAKDILKSIPGSDDKYHRREKTGLI